MDEFTRILFQMNAFDPDGIGITVVSDDFEMTVFTKREFILRNLVSLGQIRIEVVFSGKP